MLRSKYQLAAIPAAVFLVSCGGGGGGSSPATSGSGSLSGSSFKGPTAGATVCAFLIDNSAGDKKGAQVQAQAGSLPTLASGCVVTANDGTYTFVLPAGQTGDLILESTGGTYCSDESIFNGTVCSGGGTPVAMGANKLKTVAAAPADGVVSTVPLTLLTTAAVENPATLNSTNFKTAYATVAGNFGLTDTNPGSDPNAAGGLKTALTNLATYVGADTTLLTNIVSLVSGGTLTANSGSVTGTAEINCEALTEADTTVPYTYTPFLGYGPNNVPMFGPPVTSTHTLYGIGNSSAPGQCSPSDDGQSSSRTAFYGSLASMFGTSGSNGTYYRYLYAGSSCEGISTYTTGSANLKVTGTQAMPLSASMDPSKSQAGTVSKLVLTFQPDGSDTPVVQNHLFCRTQASTTTPFLGYMTKASFIADGTFTRIDGSAQVTGWTD
jgi:hypothetical protein